MPEYDFRTLSAYDFECLTRDLLQAETGLTLECFAPGKDQGVDLRHLSDKNQAMVIQCKHYVDSGYEKLLSHLKQEELPKVKKLRPSRYILATSVKLTPHRKNAIVSIFSPFCHSPKDVLGANDLNNLLGRNPQVEKNNFKLWFSSTAVTQRILNNAIYTNTESVIADIQLKLPLFVQSDLFDRARAILRQHHSCIISGQPGVGKTTLAEMLLLDYADDGFEPVVVTSDVSEANQLFDSARRQIFYYDDFLGTNMLDHLNKNEDARLSSFVTRIRQANDKRFIMTSREYILRQAIGQYEQLSRLDMDTMKLTLHVENYSRFAKAQILYNHLYFSDLPDEARHTILENRRYYDVIDHPNYNPRVIEQVTLHARRVGWRGTDFASFMKAALDQPNLVWQHAYEEQLSEESRAALLVLSTFAGQVHSDDFQSAFHEFGGLTGLHLSAGNIRNALKPLEQTFINIHLAGGASWVGFHNPSFRDFMLGHLNEFPSECDSLLRSAAFFEQGVTLWRYGHDKGDQRWGRERSYTELATWLDGHRDIVAESLTRTLHARRHLLRNVAESWDARIEQKTVIEDPALGIEGRLVDVIDVFGDVKRVPQAWLMQEVRHLSARWEYEDGNKEGAVKLIETLAEHLDVLPDELVRRIDIARDWVKERLYSVEDFNAFLKLQDVDPGCISEREYSAAVGEFLSYVARAADDLAEDEDGDRISAELEEIRSLAAGFGVDVEDELMRAEEQAARVGSRSDYAESQRESYSSSHRAGDAGAIDVLFGSL